MFTTILGAIGSILKIAATALGWIHDSALQKQGEQLQAGADAEATVQEAENAQKIDTTVSAQSRDQLIADLVRPTTAPKG